MRKLQWGMIGGGEGSQIGPAHRLGAGLDGLFEFTAGALDHRPEEGIGYGRSLGLGDRAYGSWQDMLAGEKAQDNPIDLVTVATPNSTHFEITKAFLEGGFHVLCEKPMTMTVEEGEEIVKIARTKGKICAVNYGYSGYSLVRHMKAMIARGDLGKFVWSVLNLPMVTTQMPLMRRIRGCAGATIRRRRVSRRNLPTAVFMRCIWPLSSQVRMSPN